MQSLMSTPVRSNWLGACAAAVLTLLLLAPAPGYSQSRPQAQSSATAAGREPPPSFAPLVERQLPAVVNISTTRQVQGPTQGHRPMLPQLPPGSPLEDFFRDFFGQIPQGRAQELTALGSGFVISPDGYVVTNNHVIENATEIKVILHDDTEYAAKLVGRDPPTDIALLKVEADRSLPYVQWGDSAILRPGDWVIAIGNPFGLGGTVTAGIVSARERDIQVGPYDDFLQTDASINRGNSGGPLFAADGRVVGVNTVIFSPSGGNIGIGFAVPSAMAKDVVEQLRERGSVRRGYIGVHLQRLTPELVDAMNLESRKGALISDVSEGGPAARAGLQSGDVVTKFRDQEIRNPRDLARAVAGTPPGATADLTVLRDGRTVSERIQIAELPTNKLAGAPSETPAQDGKPRLGLSLAPLTPDVKSRLGVAPDVSGVAVVGVDPNSPAAQQGIRPGDIIVRAGQQAVDDPEDVASAVRQARERGRQSLLVLLQRESDRMFVPIPLAG